MGHQLSKPITDKESSDDSNGTLIYGVSSMQGWRRTQEDAHNCILDYDTNTSYFAVYDGHLGQDVALYCSENLPQFLKQMEAYKNGDMRKALEDAFLEFDATIATPEVRERLKELAQIKRSKGGESEDEKVKENSEDSENVKSTLTNNLKESEPSDKSSLDNIESSSSSTMNEAHDVTTENSDSLNIFVCSSSSTMNETEKSDSFDNIVSNSSSTMNEAQNLTTEKSDSLDNIGSSSSSAMNEAHTLVTEKSDSLDNIVSSSSSTAYEAHNLTTEKSDSSGNIVSSSSTTTNQAHNLTTEIPDSKRKKRKKVSLDKLGLKTGCTAVVALLRENELYVANAGDSRCIVCRNGKVIEMSSDHKPLNEDEYKRIVKAGGSVDNLKGRINNRLNLSRAIGDHRYKQNKDLSTREQMIIALPDIRTLTINPSEDEFMFLACDGIWNCMRSNQEVVDIIRPAIQEGKKKLSQVCEELFDTCMKRVVGGDNMTAIIVQFNAHILKRSAEESESNETLKTEENRDSDAM